MQFSDKQGLNKRNNIERHPWESTIKDEFRCYIKYGHNSINDPHYAKESKKKTDKIRSKFAIIGNRVTEEFIYGVKLVTGLYKYRRNYFDAPYIRGVNAVEWPQVLNSLKLQYGGLAYCIPGDIAVLINNQFLGGVKELKELVEAKFNYYICPDYYNESIAEFTKFIDNSGRPCVFMHISIEDNDDFCGTLIFMLYSDIVPRTCENFMRLCKLRRGGYSGTPVHRIVKDGWIQCGGFGLKSTDLDCENFIVSHDRRGLLSMANDGRHNDCSTQFFVLLQPAPWMDKKYVAFGELIDGENTLRKIESVPTWYESPTSKIIIYQAGILNLHCQDLVVNKRCNEYIENHMEDLTEVEEIMHELILEKLYLELTAREIVQHQQEEESGVEEDRKNVRATKRFLRKKEDIEEQLLTRAKTKYIESVSYSEDVNEEYMAEEYESAFEYESETKSSELSPSPPKQPKPRRPFYFPLRDVPYPGEIESTHDLRKFIKGHYCLETDLFEEVPKKVAKQHTVSYSSDTVVNPEQYDELSLSSIESDEEKEIHRYIKLNVDRVSFAGEVIMSIARKSGKLHLLDNLKKASSDHPIKEDRTKTESFDYSTDTHGKKVSIIAPDITKSSEKIKRRPTGFPRPEVLRKIISKEISEESPEDDDFATHSNVGQAVDLRKVRIAPTADSMKPSDRTLHESRDYKGDSDTEVRRRSVLTRLINDVTYVDDSGPTLKDYRPMAEMKQGNILLTLSNNFEDRSEDITEKYLRPSFKIETPSFDRVMNIQHGKKLVRKVSSDYVKTLGQIEQTFENSIRSIEFAKKRPSLSVAEYQKRNQMPRDT